MIYIKPKQKTLPGVSLAAILFVLHVLVSSCNSGSTRNPMFTLLPPEQSGIHFRNDLHEDSSNNILDYLYFYNGGGVAVGDINNDGLPDVFFTSNQGSNKLYLNKGNLQFEDISAAAGIEGTGNWKTGVTMADVNGDGLLDVYVSVVGHYKNFKGRNELFINKGNGRFTEESEKFGLSVEGFNTQASFFDYDRDGDLDVFIVNHSVHSVETYVDSSERRKKNEYAGDKLLRCDQAGDSIYFTEVTERAGIFSSALGFGLNVLTADFNNDNWPDIYVSNDFHENDYYYINNRNGTFRELNAQSFDHESRFSMGSDLGDINNDGWLDLITLDMLPDDEKVLKSSASDDGLDIYNFKMSKGYHHQYSKNSLQLNTNGGLHFSDISLAAGVAATDWSWSPLFADFDNDGVQDLFISNGILRRPNDIDYIKYISSGTTRDLLQRGKTVDLAVIKKMPAGRVTNRLYKGKSGYGFADSSAAWGMNTPGFSNGAIYADLDLDGDLDIVINNLNEPASVFINRLIDSTRDNIRTQSGNDLSNGAGNTTRYLDIKLNGTGMNRFGYGSRISISSEGKRQTKYITASHGFQSGFAGGAHFGIGAAKVIDSVEIWWPDSTVQLLTKIPANTSIFLEQTAATLRLPNLMPPAASDSNQLLETLSSQNTGITFRHHENNFIDFDIQQLIPHQLSTQGPKMAVADVNNDGLEDLFICGAAGQAGNLFLQQNNHRFLRASQPSIESD
ncbi:MAG: CRTAC1 family protein, partial [Pedobacter sp.]